MSRDLRDDSSGERKHLEMQTLFVDTIALDPREWVWACPFCGSDDSRFEHKNLRIRCLEPTCGETYTPMSGYKRILVAS